MAAGLVLADLTAAWARFVPILDQLSTEPTGQGTSEAATSTFDRAWREQELDELARQLGLRSAIQLHRFHQAIERSRAMLDRSRDRLDRDEGAFGPWPPSWPRLRKAARIRDELVSHHPEPE